ncbi:Crp/Fnr family transcriptional regulator [Sphingomonas sp. JC676]|uniref:Crp/Fnr family transcriptional regulator n=1 Tax=Sphingomonas sp. JC676 TaxID=2768065 RepID=UPI001657BFCE|nr:Crp/Fnr family transcriptional regulator [Sphingomonas sp. JC676]MBC9033823.1 Crp/Fnr family transcriptional regulator [Sphingomonas sp. JC676]
MNSPAILNTMLERLERHRQFDAEDRTAVLALPYTVRKLRPHEHLIREGEPAENSCLLRSGFLCRHKIIAAGHRQIVSVHMAGDMVNMQNSLLKTADHNVQALTEAEVVLISGRAIIELATARPNVAIAMWLDTLIDGSIFREWIANVGRRDARSKTAHILCEFALRQERAGLAARSRYDLPMTQEQLGDALGLTPVHVNRTLKALEQAGLISRNRRSVTISDWDALRVAGDFDPAYLYLELAEGERSLVA